MNHNSHNYVSNIEWQVGNLFHNGISLSLVPDKLLDLIKIYTLYATTIIVLWSSQKFYELVFQ